MMEAGLKPPNRRGALGGESWKAKMARGVVLSPELLK